MDGQQVGGGDICCCSLVLVVLLLFAVVRCCCWCWCYLLLFVGVVLLEHGTHHRKISVVFPYWCTRGDVLYRSVMVPCRENDMHYDTIRTAVNARSFFLFFFPVNHYSDRRVLIDWSKSLAVVALVELPRVSCP